MEEEKSVKCPCQVQFESGVQMIVCYAVGEHFSSL